MVRQPPWRLVALLSCTLSFVLSPCQSAPKPANRPTLRLSLRDVPRKRRRLLTRQFGRVLQRAYLAVSAQLERLGFRPLRRKRRLVGVLFYTRDAYRRFAERHAPAFRSFDGFVRGDRWTSYLHGNSWSTLYHELVHLALGGRGLPRWVEEGLAEVVAARLCRDRSRPSPALPLDRLAQLVSGMRYNDWLPLPDLLSAKRREFVGDRAERYYALAAVLVAYLAQRSEAAKRRPSDELRLLAAPRGLQRLDVSAFRRFIDGRFASRPRRLDLLQGEPCSWQNTILGGWHFLRGQLVGRDASAIERPLLPRRRFELSLEGALGVGHLIVRLGSVYDRDPPALWLLRVDPKRVAIARGDVKPLVWRGVERSDATRFDLRLIFDERRVRLWIGGRTRIEFPRRHNFVSSIRLENRGLVTLRRLRLAER